MIQAIKALGIDKLSVDERILLIEQIWDSIAAQPKKLDVPQSHQDELDRRLAEYNSNPEVGSSWEDVKERLQGES